MKNLLAKKDFEDNCNRSSLLCHLKSTLKMAQKIDEFTGDAQLSALGLDPSDYRQRFQKILFVAAATHDIGKANSHFQNALLFPDQSQSLRHEWVSYLLLRNTEFGERIKRLFSEEVDFVLLAWIVAGHHRKSVSEMVSNKDESEMKLLVDSPDFAQYLNWFDSEQNLTDTPIFKDIDPLSLPSTQLTDGMTLEQFLDAPGRVIDTYLGGIINRDNSETVDVLSKRERKLLAALRSSLIAADVASSAWDDPISGVSNGSDMELLDDWFKDSLGRKAKPDDLDRIISCKQREIKHKDDPLSVAREKFQTEVAESSSRITLCVAGCGSGKTLAAWRWARTKCAKEGNRIFFCYPTTGTTTTGFVDYLVDQQNNVKMGDLFHSRATVDKQFHKTLYRARREQKKLKNEASLEIEKAMSTLRMWETPIVCCTVDVALRFLVNNYAGILTWPALSQALFIFDEIHSYDEKLFYSLTQFLKTVKGVPVLLLTASLPSCRLEKLTAIIQKENGGDGAVNTSRLTEWEKIKRYRRLENVSPDADPVALAVERFRKGEKVLWVCNTVKRAMKFASELFLLGDDIRDKTVVYHSRFRYCDRLKRQQECVDAFQSNSPFICVATQVAEMSLDLSADFLISDLAPVPSLIQRLGRLNRRATSDAPRLFHIVEPCNEKGELELRPYSDENWDVQAREWLKRLGNAPLSQADLAEAWKDAPVSGKYDYAPPWLTPGPWFDNVGELREDSTNIEVMLCNDYDKVIRVGVKGCKTEYVKYVIPMNRSKLISCERSERLGCYIAQNGRDIVYDDKLGAQWISDNAEDVIPVNPETLIF